MRKFIKRFLSLALACGAVSTLVSGTMVNAVAPTAIGEGTYYLRNAYSEKYLEISAQGSGASLRQNSFSGDEKQKFQLVLVNGVGQQAVYSIVPKANPELRFDIVNASSKNGTMVNLFKENSAYAYAQQFQLKPNENGTFRLLSMVSPGNEKALEIAGPSTENLATVQIWDYAEGKNQQWTLLPIESVLLPAEGSEEIAEHTVIPEEITTAVIGSGEFDGSKISFTSDKTKYKNTDTVYINLKNASLDELLAGQNVKLFRLEGKEWTEVQSIDPNYSWTEEIMVVNAKLKNGIDYSVDLYKRYGKLKPGTYKFALDVVFGSRKELQTLIEITA